MCDLRVNASRVGVPHTFGSGHSRQWSPNGCGTRCRWQPRSRTRSKAGRSKQSVRYVTGRAEGPPGRPSSGVGCDGLGSLGSPARECKSKANTSPTEVALTVTDITASGRSRQSRFLRIVAVSGLPWSDAAILGERRPAGRGRPGESPATPQRRAPRGRLRSRGWPWPRCRRGLQAGRKPAGTPGPSTPLSERTRRRQSKRSAALAS